MPHDRFPILLSALSPRKQEQFTAAIAELDAGLSAGEIANARFGRAKETVSRALDYAWSASAQKPFSWNRDYLKGCSEEERTALYEISGPPQTNTIAKMTRRGAAIGDTEAGRAIRAVLAEAGEVLDMVKRSKEIAVKKRPAARPQSATERYSAPAASRSAMAAVLGELQAITREARDGLAASLRERHEAILSRFMAAQEAHEGKGRFSVYDYARDIGKGRADPYIRQKLEAVLTIDRQVGRERYIVKPDAPEIMSRLAGEEADAICASFIEKNLVKLAPIVEGKGNYQDMEVIGRNVYPGAMEGRLRLSFEDGASFEARSQGVLSFSQYGTPFMRYPLTFHGVRLPGGDMMECPSEKKMNEIFARDTSSPEP